MFSYFAFAVRFDIDDRKGLEIVLLTALLTFSDANEAIHLHESPSQNKAISRNVSVAPTNELPPPTPPKPAPKTGVERIAEMQAVKGEYNEIIISDEGSVAEYALYCSRLLQVCWNARILDRWTYVVCRMMLCFSYQLSLRKQSKFRKFFKLSRKPNE